jgi:hypothetical protein
MSPPTVVQCAVCREARTPCSARWFYVIENRWTDRLKIFEFHESIAHQPGSYHVCCASHVRELVVHWMTLGRLDLPFARVPEPTSEASSTRRPHSQRDAGPAQQSKPVTPRLSCLGEIAVHRESLTRILRENPQALASVLETLVCAIDPSNEAETLKTVRSVDDTLSMERRLA